MGLFHGNRLEEFAHLQRGDIGQEDGVWFLHITDDAERRLENAQSRRKVPLHSELIGIGFLDYVAGITTAPEDPLFPELKPRGRDGKRAMPSPSSSVTITTPSAFVGVGWTIRRSVMG